MAKRLQGSAQPVYITADEDGNTNIGNVDVSTMPPITISEITLPDGASTSAKQDILLTELQKKADLTETQPVSINQNVVESVGNSSTTNLSVSNSYTFEGVASSTLGVSAIQVGLFADKNCNVYIEQSTNNTPNWDISDHYHYEANSSFGITIQATTSYFRVRITTNNETTTKFRLQSVLCPIAVPLPRSLDPNGNLKVATAVDEYGWQSENTPMGEIRVVEPTRLIGTNFEGTTIDNKFWTTAAAGTAASIAQAAAQLLITSGTSNAAAVSMYSLRRARYVSGISLRYRAVIQLSAGLANNKRRWGIGYGATLPTITDGAWFQFDGTEFAIVTCKGTTQTKVISFNGNLGATYDPGTNAKTYEIYWTNSKVYFVIGDEILHTVSASTATWSNTMNFHIFSDSLNADVVTQSTMAIRVASIHRLGKYETQPIYYHLDGNAATHTLKLGPGILHKIIFNNTSGTNITIVDNITGTTPVIGVIITESAALGEWDYSVPFNTGLILITTGNSLDATIIYE